MNLLLFELILSRVINNGKSYLAMVGHSATAQTYISDWPYQRVCVIFLRATAVPAGTAESAY